MNITAKRIGLQDNFSKYYRSNYGLLNPFQIKYRSHNSTEINKVPLNSISYKDFIEIKEHRYSKPFDEVNFKDWKENEIYSYKQIDQKMNHQNKKIPGEDKLERLMDLGVRLEVTNMTKVNILVINKNKNNN